MNRAVPPHGGASLQTRAGSGLLARHDSSAMIGLERFRVKSVPVTSEEREHRRAGTGSNRLGPASATEASRFLTVLDPQRWRLASGLVLFAFVLTHFLNHALGHVSLDAMSRVQGVRRAVWGSWPGSLL